MFWFIWLYKDLYLTKMLIFCRLHISKIKISEDLLFTIFQRGLITQFQWSLSTPFSRLVSTEIVGFWCRCVCIYLKFLMEWISYGILLTPKNVTFWSELCRLSGLRMLNSEGTIYSKWTFKQVISSYWIKLA